MVALRPAGGRGRRISAAGCRSPGQRYAAREPAPLVSRVLAADAPGPGARACASAQRSGERRPDGVSRYERGALGSGRAAADAPLRSGPGEAWDQDEPGAGAAAAGRTHISPGDRRRVGGHVGPAARRAVREANRCDRLRSHRSRSCFPGVAASSSWHRRSPRRVVRRGARSRARRAPHHRAR